MLTNYKRNTITDESRRAKKIVTDFTRELKRTKTEFLHAGFPVKFINYTIMRFNEEKKQLLTLKCLFVERKLVVTILNSATKNEKRSKGFRSKLEIRNFCQLQSQIQHYLEYPQFMISIQ